MRGVRTGHVVLGGLAAGLIINIGETLLNLVVLGDQMTAFMARLNLPPVTGAAMGAFAVLGFALGIGITWLYAGIRTRYGPGVATALRAGAAVYFFAYLYPSLGFVVMGVFPARMTAIMLVWGACELLVAAVAGAWVYTEAPVRGEAEV